MFCKLAYDKSGPVVKECLLAMDSLASLKYHVKQDSLVAWLMLVAASIGVLLSAVAIKDDLIAIGTQAWRRLRRARVLQRPGEAVYDDE